jgi:hypothetical protein
LVAGSPWPIHQFVQLQFSGVASAPESLLSCVLLSKVCAAAVNGIDAYPVVKANGDTLIVAGSPRSR